MRIRSVALGAVAAALLALGAAGTADAAGGREAVEAVSRGDYQAAVGALSELERRDRNAFLANNYDYLLARVQEQRGDLAAAAARYAEVVARSSNLAEYALWRLAGIARLEGNLPLERRYLSRLRAEYPSSLMARDALTRLARSAGESGDSRTVVQLLSPLAGPKGAAARDALARVSRAKLQLGDTAAARAGFSQLLEGSQDDYALAAARGLDEIEASQGPAPGDAEHMRRGAVYMTNRDFTGARKHFVAAAEGGTAAFKADALYQAGLTYYRVNDNDTAVEWWERAAREFPSAPAGIKAFYWVGHAHQRAGRNDAALARYQEFIARYPADEQAEGAYRNAVDTARSAGDFRAALAWADRAEQAKPRSTLATFAAFNRAKTLLAMGDAAGALAEFGRLKGYDLSSGGAGMPSPGEVDILRGVTLERLGRVSEAVALYLSMTPGREEYFGNRATLRLLALARTPQGRTAIEPILNAALAAARGSGGAAAKAAADRALRLTEDDALRREMLGVLRAAYAQLPAYARVSGQPLVPVGRAELAGGRPPLRDRSHEALGAELAFLGLWDEAAPELEASGLGARAPHSMAVYNARGGRAHVAVQEGEQLATRLPRDFRVELLPREASELIYPAPYRDALRKYALPLDLDPRFELSIARQESRFKPWVKSGAAARGLVQFIPETADRIAGALGVKGFEQDDLYVPQVAVRFGARYLSDLFKLFPNNPYAVAASYNGGEDNVARWAKRAADPEDYDLLVSEIGYKESKTYVFRVLNNFWAYQALYTRELNPR